MINAQLSTHTALQTLTALDLDPISLSNIFGEI